MTDIWEYQTIIDFEYNQLLLKGVRDSDYKFDPNPPFWLNVKVTTESDFCGETELYVQKQDIKKFIEELTIMNKEKKGNCQIKCLGWGSYINFEIGKSGAIYVSGLLNERFDEENNHLRFKFTSVQKRIPNLIQVLEKIIAE
jgi:hypothetical protein